MNNAVELIEIPNMEVFAEYSDVEQFIRVELTDGTHIMLDERELIKASELADKGEL